MCLLYQILRPSSADFSLSENRTNIFQSFNNSLALVTETKHEKEIFCECELRLVQSGVGASRLTGSTKEEGKCIIIWSHAPTIFRSCISQFFIAAIIFNIAITILYPFTDCYSKFVGEITPICVASLLRGLHLLGALILSLINASPIDAVTDLWIVQYADKERNFCWAFALHRQLYNGCYRFNNFFVAFFTVGVCVLAKLSVDVSIKLVVPYCSSILPVSPSLYEFFWQVYFEAELRLVNFILIEYQT